MRAGNLRHRVIIEENQPITRDSFNKEVEHWVEVTTLWAAIEPVNANQFIEQSRDQVQITHKVRIRHREGLKAKIMRVRYGARLFDIEGVLDQKEEHREIHLMCKERQP